MSQQGWPPGWYQDPDAPNTVRYWNGTAYTDLKAPMPRPGEIDSNVRLVGWVCALVFPIVGFVIGCMCVAKGPARDGWAMVAVSLIVSAVAVAALLEASQAGI